MRTTQKIFLCLAIAFALGSCISNKRLVYLQNNNLKEQKPIQITNPKPEYIIQSNDVLSVVVKTTQTELNELFNIANVGSSFINNPGSFFLAGYSVSDSGYIALPTVGKIKVAGLSISEANTVVQKHLSQYLNDANVQVKVISFKISVLGEVKDPGYYYVYNNQATIFEGLGLAGDLTDFGNRNKVKLIRQTETGSEVVLLDITDPNIVKSKYYYLLPNDVLYVQPLRAKIARTNLQPLGILFGGITAAAVVIRFFLPN
ncbi:MAG TPA: polysaccharide biosynthesis/export family protein [Cytophagales bacterium]|nr:polysaccharide biosynthesis/export family protein [Cytophagales bacterium]